MESLDCSHLRHGTPVDFAIWKLMIYASGIFFYHAFSRHLQYIFFIFLSGIPISQAECLGLSVMTFSFPSSPGCCHSGTGLVLLLPPPKCWTHSCAGHHAPVRAVLGTQPRNSCTLGKNSTSWEISPGSQGTFQCDPKEVFHQVFL